jgi:hypothetical protein
VRMLPTIVRRVPRYRKVGRVLSRHRLRVNPGKTDR